MSEFEQWFTDQDFYTNMRFIHGDALFAKDGDVYRVLPVQMTHVAWVEKQSEIDQLKAQLIDQGQRFNEQSQKVKDLEHHNEKLKAEKVGLLKLAKQWREESKELCGVDDKYVIGSLLSCAEQLEEALRGEHENS